MGRPEGDLLFPYLVEHWSGEWRNRAACLGSDTALWFERERYEIMKQAKEICATCQVKQECLEYALETKPEYGIFGGASPSLRRKLLKERKR